VDAGIDSVVPPCGPGDVLDAKVRTFVDHVRATLAPALKADERALAALAAPRGRALSAATA